MSYNAFVQYDNIVPLLASVDIASTITATPYIDLKTANHCAFLVNFGLITSASADTEVVTVEAATAADGMEAAVTFRYRLSGAVGANTWGAVTAATTAGVALDPSTDDNKCLWIEVDIDALAANDYTFVRLKLTHTTDMTACLVSVVGIVDAIYKQTVMVTATASASA